MNYQEFFSRYSYDRRADLVATTRFGSIYKARSTKRDMEVLLRIMPCSDSGPSLAGEVAFVNALPANQAIVRYSKHHTFEEATGEIDCAVMDYFPLGNLPKLLEDWKLSDEERSGLCRRIIEAAEFLRSAGVNLPQFDPATVYVTEAESQLYPHLTDLSAVESNNADYDEQVMEYLSVASFEEETLPPAEALAEDTSIQAEQAEEIEDYAEEAAEEEGPKHNKALLLLGVVVTWIAITGLIYFLHEQRNAAEAEAPKADTTAKVIYPADEYALEQKALEDSIAKAKADSAANAQLDSALAAKATVKQPVKKEAAPAEEAAEAPAPEAAQPEKPAETQQAPTAPATPAAPATEPAQPAPSNAEPI